jgi:hypothetical protein
VKIRIALVEYPNAAAESVQVRRSATMVQRSARIAFPTFEWGRESARQRRKQPCPRLHSNLILLSPENEAI